MIRRVRFSAVLLVVLRTVPTASVAAQTTSPPDSGRAPSPAAPSRSAAGTPLNFSGVLFGSYGIQTSTSPRELPNQTDNAFLVDRAYLTFRMPAGERTSVRITTDVYQDAGGNAYTLRAKYAYLEYGGRARADGLQAFGRIGILHNVIIDHEENFWPRYLGQVAVERAGFFSSADVGIASGLTLPHRVGELYATLVNGSGYTARETNRFKDLALRLSLTPLARVGSGSLWQTFTVTVWGYKGALASRWADPAAAAGTRGTVGSALDRSRAGVFLGVRDPRLTLGAEWARRHDEGERGANLVTDPRIVTGVSGRVLSAFVVARPGALAHGAGWSPLGVVARYDAVSPTLVSRDVATPTRAENGYHNAILGLTWDLSSRAQLALDYQESLASRNGLSAAPPTPSRGYFGHFVVNF